MIIAKERCFILFPIVNDVLIVSVKVFPKCASFYFEIVFNINSSVILGILTNFNMFFDKNVFINFLQIISDINKNLFVKRIKMEFKKMF